MNPGTYVPLMMLIVFLLISQQNQRQIISKMISKKKHGNKERKQMKDMARRFLGKECIINTFNSQLDGTLKEVGDSAILLSRKGNDEVINLDFIVRIREFPRNKNGKKKSVVLD